MYLSPLVYPLASRPTSSSGTRNRQYLSGFTQTTFFSFNFLKALRTFFVSDKFPSAFSINNSSQSPLTK